MAILKGMKKLSDEELKKVNGGYILDRGENCGTSSRFALVDDITGECYCMSNRPDGVADHYKANENSTHIISLDEYRAMFGKDF